MSITKSRAVGVLKIVAQKACIVSLVFLSLFCDKSNPFGNSDDNLVFGTMTDVEGNVYKTIAIGNQVWMAENLRVTKYNDSSAIPLVPDSSAWALLVTPGYCYYANTTNSNLRKKFGALYNWHAVNTGKLAPLGWHAPTSAEWDTLQDFLIAHGYNWNGATIGNEIAKSIAAKSDWLTFNLGTPNGSIGNDLSNNNRSGFSALPSGYRFPNGLFLGDGDYCVWWSNTQNGTINAYNRGLDIASPGLSQYANSKSYGYSVRLVKD